MAGNYVQSFFGSTEAAKWLVENGLAKSLSSHSHITNCCNKKKEKLLMVIYGGMLYYHNKKIYQL